MRLRVPFLSMCSKGVPKEAEHVRNKFVVLVVAALVVAALVVVVVEVEW